MTNLLETFQLRLQELTNRLELLKRQFDSFNPILNDGENLSSLVTSLQSDVANFKTDLSNYRTDLNSFNSTYATLTSSIEENSTNINNLEYNNTQLTQDVTSLNTEVDNLNSSVGTLETHRLEHLQYLTDLSNRTKFLEKTFLELVDRASNSEDKIESLETTCNTLNTTINNNQTSLNNKINNTQTSLLTEINTVQSNQNEINSSLQSSIDTLNNDYDNLIQNQQEVNTSVQTMTDEQSRVSALVDEMKRKQDYFNSSFEVLNTAVSKHDLDLYTLWDDYTKVRFEHQNLVTLSDTHTNQIDELETQIENLQSNSGNNETLNEINARLNEFDLELTYLTDRINTFAPGGENATEEVDNELYFILAGTYIFETDIDALANGTYQPSANEQIS